MWIENQKVLFQNIKLFMIAILNNYTKKKVYKFFRSRKKK